MTITRYLDDNLQPIDGLFKMSTAARGSGSEDGNIYFNYVDWTIELITYEELNQIDFGSGLVDNPFNDYDGATLRSIYDFYIHWLRHDETLRTYKQMIDGTYVGTGAYKLLNGIKFSESGGIPDYRKLKISGWGELDENGGVKRVYSGITGIANTLPGTQCQYQLVDENADVLNFLRTGPISEPLLVYDDGNFDKRGYIKILQRRWGSVHDEADLTKMGVTSLIGQNNNTAINEVSHPTTGSYNENDVIGGAAIAPFTGMRLERFATPQVRTGFDNGDGNFTWILHNDNNGTLAECIAFLDACARSNDDIDSGDTTVTVGIKTKTWYKIINGVYETQSGLDGSLHIDNVPVADRQKIKQVDDTGVKRYYPVQAVVKVTVLDVTTQNPIEGARVLVEKTSDGADLFNGETDANGEISFGITWTEDVPISGRVRKSTCNGDPSCRFYKGGIIGGTITSSGFAVTAYLVRD